MIQSVGTEHLQAELENLIQVYRAINQTPIVIPNVHHFDAISVCKGSDDPKLLQRFRLRPPFELLMQPVLVRQRQPPVHARIEHNDNITNRYR